MKQISYTCAVICMSFLTTLQCAQTVSDSVAWRIKQQEEMQQKLIAEIAQLAQGILRDQDETSGELSEEEKKALEAEIKKLLENQQSRQRNHERSNSI